MQNYIRDIPTKLYFGKGGIEHLSESLKPFGKNVLLTYGGGSIKRIGLYDDVIRILKENDFNVFELSGIEPNPRIESVIAGVELCKKHHIDVILAVGGGSTIDCSKVIAVGAYYEGEDLWEMVENTHEIAAKAIPLVTILTLSATGSEYDSAAVISNLKTNQKIGTYYTYPAVSICDPTYTFSVSPYQTAAGSADIMSHIFECYFNRITDCDLTDGICEAILRSTMKNCLIAIKEPNNYSARANLMTNSNIACSDVPDYGYSYTGWACHFMEHELSAYYDITHGVGLAIITPRWMRFILDKDPSITPRFAQFARNVMGLEGKDEDKLAKQGIDALEDYFKSSGIPMSLSELGINEEHFLDMAKSANKSNSLSCAYVPLTTEDVIQIYKMCL